MTKLLMAQEGIGSAGCEAGGDVGRREISADRRSLESMVLLAVRELGVPISSLARKPGISIPSVTKSVTRASGIAEARE